MATGGARKAAFRFVVLVTRPASAAEIGHGRAPARRGATVVGTRTFGKGRVKGGGSGRCPRRGARHHRLAIWCCLCTFTPNGRNIGAAGQGGAGIAAQHPRARPQGPARSRNSTPWLPRRADPGRPPSFRPAREARGASWRLAVLRTRRRRLRRRPATAEGEPRGDSVTCCARRHRAGPARILRASADRRRPGRDRGADDGARAPRRSTTRSSARPPMNPRPSTHAATCGDLPNSSPIDPGQRERGLDDAITAEAIGDETMAGLGPHRRRARVRAPGLAPGIVVARRGAGRACTARHCRADAPRSSRAIA